MARHHDSRVTTDVGCVRFLSFLLPILLMAAPVAANDVLMIGTGSTSRCVMAQGTTVTVPVYIQDFKGTPLDGDKPGNRIQAFSFRVVVSPVEAFQIEGGQISATVEKAGVTFGNTPIFQGVFAGPDSISYLVSYDELTNPLGLSLNSQTPDLVANIKFNLNPDWSGGTINLQLDPDNSALSDQSGLVSETQANGYLLLRSTCIQALAELEISIDCPATIRPGEFGQIRISLDQPAPANITIGLTSSSSAVSIVSSVSIPAGSSSAEVNLSGAREGSSTITATLPGSAGGGSASCQVEVKSCPGAPAGLDPPSGATGVPLQGSLKWTSAGADNYRVYLGPAGSGCSTLLGTTSATSIEHDTLLPGTEYEWRTESVTAGCPVQSSPCATFTTEATAPVIHNFNASPSRIPAGESTKLVWSVSGAESITITPAPGMVGRAGAVDVSPSETTTYTLSATSAAGTSTAMTTVTVETGPNVILLKQPDPLRSTPGEDSTISRLVLANAGGNSAVLTFETDDTFLTISSESLTLDAGEIAVVELQGNVAEAGAFPATITISIGGTDETIEVPVILLASDQTETPLPGIDPARIDLVRQPGAGAAFSITLSNPFDAPIDLILDPESNWIIADEGSITIPAGGSVNAEFTVDPNRRPDVAGSLRGGIIVETGSKTTRIEVTDTILSAISTETPVPSSDTVVIPLTEDRIDLAIGSASAMVSISHIDAAGNGQTITLDASDGLWLADPARTIFSEDGGTLVVEAGNASVHAEAGGGNTRHSIPAFRSGNGAKAGESWWITGVEPGATTLVIQDVSGAASSVDIELLDAAGNTTTLANREVIPWQSATLADLGTATSAIIRNREDSAGRIAAFAQIEMSGETWIVTDDARVRGYTHEALRILPFVEGTEADTRRRNARRPADGRVENNRTSHSRTELTLFNGRTAPAEISIVFHDLMGPTVSRTVSVGARETVVVDSLAALFDRSMISGRVTIEPTDGAISSSSRIVRQTAEGLRVAVVPVTALPSGLQIGQSRTFAGLEDEISLDGIRDDTSDLGLIEMTGSDIVARIVAWDRALPDLRITRDVTIPGSRMVTLSGMLRALMESPTDFRAPNLVVSVAVTGGEGTVLPFIVMRDLTNGDLIVRAE